MPMPKLKIGWIYWEKQQEMENAFCKKHLSKNNSTL